MSVSELADMPKKFCNAFLGYNSTWLSLYHRGWQCCVVRRLVTPAQQYSKKILWEVCTHEIYYMEVNYVC